MIKSTELPGIVHRIRAMGLTDKIDKQDWQEALHLLRSMRVENYWHLLHVMVMSSIARITGIVKTAVMAVVLDKLSVQGGNAFDQLVRAVLLPSTSTREVVLKWISLHLLFVVLEHVLKLLQCKISKTLSAIFRLNIDTVLYRAIGDLDTEFFDVHSASELIELSRLGEQLQEADLRLQRTVSRTIGLINRLHYLIHASPRLTGAVTLIAILEAGWNAIDESYLWIDDAEQPMQETTDSYERFAGVLQTLKTLRCFGKEKEHFEDWAAIRLREADQEVNHRATNDFFP